MFAHKKPEVLVVGAGPVGLFTALALVHRGVRVQVVEREPRTSTHSYALALHAESLRLLEQVDALTDVLDKAYRVRRVGIYDAVGRKAGLRIADLAEDHSFLAVLPQHALEDHLTHLLARRGVKVEWSHEVSQLEPHDDHVDVRIDRLSLDTLGYSVQHSEWVVAKSKQHQVPFVVGADGHSSVVRRRLGVQFPTVGPSTDFAVFEFRTDGALGDEMLLVFGEDTTTACWPLPDGYCRWSFELPGPGLDIEERRKDHDLIQLESERDPSLSEDRLRELLAQRAPWFRGNVGPIRWRMSVHFERRLAESFGRDRVWLVGDAGHLTGPVGMQSMNVGFREAADLAQALAGRLHGGTGGTHELEHYDETRRREWSSLLGVRRALRTRAGTEPWIAAQQDRLVSCLPASGDDLVRLAGQLGFDWRANEEIAAR
ncbi:MAG TPA: NAD(P)/FAD-dependent oxidoreductase [Planctomycetota bacterium]|nr:NAD(P)/FAD-dependent oxidoreductase [Planctomycetota bacterium]